MSASIRILGDPLDTRRPNRPGVRWKGVQFTAFLLFTALTVAIAPAQPAAAATCNSSGPGTYSVSLCIDSPAGGATVTGDTTVSASFTVTGSSPGVSKLNFYLDSNHLLTDYEAPYTFVLPSDTFVDGAVALEVEAVMRDGFVTSLTTISITLSNGVSVPPDPPTGFTPTSGTTPPPGQPFVVAATGDGASGQTTSDDVASSIVDLDPNLFLYLGDVYEKGTYTEFKNWYGEGARFGALAPITNPILGNHERQGGQAPGYDRYWASPEPNYSYDANGWHFIAMDLQLDGAQPSQTAWLAEDLAASTAECTIAYFHYPVLSVGPQGDTPALFSTWEQLVDGGVDIVLTGHDHSYQRWVPMDRSLAADPGGATQFVVGSGGHGIQGFVRSDPRLAAGADTTPAAYGALSLELNTHGAAFRYTNTADALLDSGTLQCSGTPADTTAPSVPTGVSAVAVSGIQVDLSWAPSTDNVGVDSYTIYRDGNAIATVGGAGETYTDHTVQPNTTYSYTVEAHDAAGNASGQSTAGVVTTPDPPPSLTFNPVADSYVDGGNAGSNFGTSDQLRVDASPDLRSYLRFDVAGLTGSVTSATLRVHANSNHSQGFQVQEVTENTWDELSINYTNAPGFGPERGQSGATTGGAYVEIDVTGYVNGNGSFSFALTPLNNTNLRLSSREAGTPPELVIMQDTSGNNPPSADDVVVTTDEDAGVGWTPVVSDPDGDPLTCSIAAVPANGTATVETDCSSGTYTPDPDYHGPDSFTYEVSDGPLTDTGTVTVTVNPLNDAPVADPQSVTTTEDTPITINLTGSDIDGDCPLVFAVDTQPSTGSLGPIGNQPCIAGAGTAEVIYTPGSGFTGADSFTVTVTDPAGAASTPATISITVDAPQTNFTFNPVADSYVTARNTTGNFGTSNQLRVDASPDMRSYLRFDVAGLTGSVTSATLRVHANSNHSQGFRVQEVTENTWDELSINYDNAPGFGPVLGQSGATTNGAYVEIDVTGDVNGNGSFSFALTAVDSTTLRLASREAGTPPELIIVQAP